VKLLGAVAWVALLIVVLVAGCARGSPEEQGTETTERPLTEPGTQDDLRETTSETSRVPARGDEVAGGEATDVPFTAAPEMNGGSGEAADGIRGVRFGEHDGYERAVVDFGSGGEPAPQVPVWSLSSPTGEGYARITFPSVDATSVSGGTFGGSILDNFYVVRAPGKGMFVDIFATGAFLYRVIELSNPGRLVIDYRPASVDLSFPIPAQAERTVLFEPREGEAITSPLRVSGYSRNFEASNTLVLRDASGKVLAQRTVLSNDWAETWGYFETSLEFPTFEGRAILRVGAESARDGSFEGVEVPVAYGGGKG
jgi:hypothetical protein